jgi:hypothetical protein
MTEKLVKLYNTLATIETKGEHTKTMADCLRFVERMAVEAKQQETEAQKEPVSEVDT